MWIRKHECIISFFPLVRSFVRSNAIDRSNDSALDCPKRRCLKERNKKKARRRRRSLDEPKDDKWVLLMEQFPWYTRTQRLMTYPESICLKTIQSTAAYSSLRSQSLRVSSNRIGITQYRQIFISVPARRWYRRSKSFVSTILLDLRNVHQVIVLPLVRGNNVHTSFSPTYPSLFTLEKTQCRGVDLHAQVSLPNPYDDQPGIALKGDNLARMLALRSGTNMLNVERLADEMIMYGLVRFGKQSETRYGERIRRIHS